MRICLACGLLLLFVGCNKSNRDSSFTPVKIEMNYSVEDLVAGLKKEDVEERKKAVQGLKKKGEAAKAAAPALVEALKDKDKEVRDTAAEALAALGPEGRTQAVPACLVMIRASDEATRQQGQELLALVSPASMKVFELKDAAKRRDVATDLVTKEADIVEVIPVLLEVRKEAAASKQPDIVQLVDYVSMHGKLNKAEAVPALIVGLEDSNPHVRAGTLVLLERLGKLATAALPTLTQCMKNERDRKVYDQYMAAYRKVSGWEGATPDPVGGPTKVDEAWATDFPTFLLTLRTILGPNPVWPTKDEPGLLTITEGGKDDFLVPKRYPPGNVALSTRIFQDKTVTWELVVEDVDEEDEDVIVYFELPETEKLRNVHPRLVDMHEFAVRMAPASREAARKLKEGQKVTIKAEVGHEPLDGIYLMFGVGAFNDQIHLSIQLRKGVLVR